MAQEAVLITGSSGFLGRHLTEAFRAQGRVVHGVDRRPPNPASDVQEIPDTFEGLDLTEGDTLTALLEDREVTLVVHAAGTADVTRSFLAPIADLSAHVTTTAHVLDALRRTKPRPRFLLISSAAVYGEPARLPISEETSLEPVSPYGYHKWQQELLADEYHRIFGVPTVRARVFSTFGPGLKRLAVWDFVTRALSGERDVRGTGAETRDYLYVKDLARAMVRVAARSPFEGEAVNIASGTETRIDTLVTMIMEELGLFASPQYDGKVERGKPTRWCADISRLSSYGFEASWSLREGIRETVAWIGGELDE